MQTASPRACCNSSTIRQLARRSLEWGGDLDPDELVITSGCIEALHLSLRAVTQPGDVVAIEFLDGASRQ